MKRSTFAKKPTVPLKRSGFKASTKPKITPKKRDTLPKRELMPNRIKRAKKALHDISHKHIRRRDSIDPSEIKGYCCTCGKLCEGGDFQAGHYEPDSTGGALLRYHPYNMHGQGGYCCNINKNHQQKMGNEYTFFMIETYGLEYVEKLRALKQKSIKADIIFYETMIDLYKEGDEGKIILYLESLA